MVSADASRITFIVRFSSCCERTTLRTPERAYTKYEIKNVSVIQGEARRACRRSPASTRVAGLMVREMTSFCKVISRVVEFYLQRVDAPGTVRARRSERDKREKEQKTHSHRLRTLNKLALTRADVQTCPMFARTRSILRSSSTSSSRPHSNEEPSARTRTTQSQTRLIVLYKGTGVFVVGVSG